MGKIIGKKIKYNVFNKAINSSYNSCKRIKSCINKAKIKLFIFAMYQNYPLALRLGNLMQRMHIDRVNWITTEIWKKSWKCWKNIFDDVTLWCSIPSQPYEHKLYQHQVQQYQYQYQHNHTNINIITTISTQIPTPTPIPTRPH